MEERIRSIVEGKLAELGATGISFAVDRTSDLAHGDYAVNAAMAAAKQLGKNPREIAEEIAAVLRESLGADALRVEVAGPGFVNVALSMSAVDAMLQEALEQGTAWGKVVSDAPRRVMVEYGNPNPFKEMHIGHLMGTIVGEAISRLVEASGAHLIRDTFGGDVGPHVAKALWALRKKGVTDIGNAKEIGEAYLEGSRAYDEDATAKEEIDSLNTEIYAVVAGQDNPETLSEDGRVLLTLWRKGREVSMEEFNRLFKILGAHFDYTFYDSDTTAGGVDAVMAGLERGVFEKSDGAIIYKGEKKGLHTLVFITSRGNPTYETKDIGLAFLKESRAETDEVIIVTAVEQASHFKIFLAALEDIAPLIAKKMKHVSHGLLRLTTGKMSSRKGNIITASDLIAGIIERAAERTDDPLIAEAVGLAAVKYMILRQSSMGEVVFDEEKSLSLEGDSGPYLQYAAVRAQAILTTAQEKGLMVAPQEIPAEPYDIMRLVIRFPDIVARASRELAPHHIAQYLTQLAGAWNSFYAQERIIGGEYEAYKLQVAQAFVQAMRNGLELLAITIPERM